MKRIPAFILIAAFVASRNPESSDKKMFKGGIEVRNRRRRKRVKRNVLMNERAVPINRIIALAQSLLSLHSTPQFAEEFMFDQSAEYYQ